MIFIFEQKYGYFFPLFDEKSLHLRYKMVVPHPVETKSCDLNFMNYLDQET